MCFGRAAQQRARPSREGGPTTTLAHVRRFAAQCSSIRGGVCICVCVCVCVCVRSVCLGVWSHVLVCQRVGVSPAQVYKLCGWQGWGTWLGTGNQQHQIEDFFSFAEAHAHALSLGLAGCREWRVWSKTGARPARMPAQPHKVYKVTKGRPSGGWAGWGHWLGTGNTSCRDGQKRTYLPFKEALVFARSLGLKGEKAWRAWRKSGARPANVPVAPASVYRGEGWSGMSHWLGSGIPSGTSSKSAGMLSHADACAYVRPLGLHSTRDWHAWCQSGHRPSNVPARPDRHYRDWVGWEHWLDGSQACPVDLVVTLDPPTGHVPVAEVLLTEEQICSQVNGPAPIPHPFTEEHYRGCNEWL